MRVEVAFELEESGEKLEIPEKFPDEASGYFDLRGDPGSLVRLEEARRHPPLRNFLVAVNSDDSLFSTTRCKTWIEPRDLKSASAAGTEPCAFASRVDLVFALEPYNFARSHYDALAQRLRELLSREPGPDTLRAELRVRLCRFVALRRWGFGLSIVLCARGNTPEQAELRWGLGLARIQQALMFCSRILRQQIAQVC